MSKIVSQLGNWYWSSPLILFTFQQFFVLSYYNVYTYICGRIQLFTILPYVQISMFIATVNTQRIPITTNTSYTVLVEQHPHSSFLPCLNYLYTLVTNYLCCIFFILYFKILYKFYLDFCTVPLSESPFMHFSWFLWYCNIPIWYPNFSDILYTQDLFHNIISILSITFRDSGVSEFVFLFIYFFWDSYSVLVS